MRRPTIGCSIPAGRRVAAVFSVPHRRPGPRQPGRPSGTHSGLLSEDSPTDGARLGIQVSQYKRHVRLIGS